MLTSLETQDNVSSWNQEYISSITPEMLKTISDFKIISSIFEDDVQTMNKDEFVEKVSSIWEEVLSLGSLRKMVQLEMHKDLNTNATKELESPTIRNS